jgi:carbonic anhydrase
MEKLIEGVHKFRTDEFGNYRKLFRKLSQEGQDPHTLFITCSDSRVLAELITQSKPGDLFVVKNVGNIVPPAGVTGSTNSTAAAIEFAVESLHVSDIVVCGHSQCGAMEALLRGLPEPDSRCPTCANGSPSPRRSGRSCKRNTPTSRATPNKSPPPAKKTSCLPWRILHSYPCVEKRLADGTLRLHGWFFKIATAELFAFDPDTKQFLPLVTDKPSAEQP